MSTQLYRQPEDKEHTLLVSIARQNKTEHKTWQSVFGGRMRVLLRILT